MADAQPVNKAVDLRVDAAESRSDGALYNAVLGVGTRLDKFSATRTQWDTMLGWEDLERLYVQSWICRRIVDLVADTITSRPLSIKMGTEDTELKDAFDEVLKEMRVMPLLNEGLKLQRLYGGSILLLNIDDGQPPDQPVNLKRIRAIRNIYPLDLTQISPQPTSGYFNLSDPDFYIVTTTQYSTTTDKIPSPRPGEPATPTGPSTLTSANSITVHKSRILRIDGDYLPWRLRQRNRGWGVSILQTIWDSYQRWEIGMRGVSNMLGDFDMFVQRIRGLGEMIRQGREKDIRARFEANLMAKSIYRGMVVDAEAEDVNWVSRPLTGADSLLERLMTDIAGACGMPQTLLFGESPGGLGRDGRYEERTFCTKCESWRKMSLDNPINTLFRYMLLSKEGPTGGYEPDDWEVEWPSLFTLTDDEKLQQRSIQSQLDTTYNQLGVISKEEIRSNRFGGPEFSIETVLDPSADPTDPNYQIQQQMLQQYNPLQEQQTQMEEQQAQMEADQQAAQEEAAAPDELDQTDRELDIESKAQDVRKKAAEADLAEKQAKQGPPKPGAGTSTTKRSKTDALDIPRLKRLISTNGLTLGLTHEPGDERFGAPMKTGYGHIRSTWGLGKDGQSIDAYWGGSESTRVYRVRQLKQTGEYDEDKIMFGYPDMAFAKNAFLSHAGQDRFGGIELMSPDEINALRGDV